MIPITDTIAIPDEEITFTASRSGGPGGQNVNKVNTRVTLVFDVKSSPSLAEEQRELIMKRLASRLTQEGVLRLACQSSRSQADNRKEAIRRFAVLLKRALYREPARKPTRPARAVRERRLEQKKRRATLKEARRRPEW